MTGWLASRCGRGAFLLVTLIGLGYDPGMLGQAKDHKSAELFLAKHGWQRGKSGKNLKCWFLPRLEAPHVSFFWNDEGLPCMTYDTDNDRTGRGPRMVWEGKKLERFSYGMNQLLADNPGADKDEAEATDGAEASDESSFSRWKKSLNVTCVKMRDW